MFLRFSAAAEEGIKKKVNVPTFSETKQISPCWTDRLLSIVAPAKSGIKAVGVKEAINYSVHMIFHF